jgi:hypothetical protein
MSSDLVNVGSVLTTTRYTQHRAQASPAASMMQVRDFCQQVSATPPRCDRCGGRKQLPAPDVLRRIMKSVFRLAARRTICPRGLPAGIRAGE